MAPPNPRATSSHLTPHLLQVIHHVLSAGDHAISLNELRDCVSPDFDVGPCVKELIACGMATHVRRQRKGYVVLNAIVPTSRLRDAMRELAESAFPTPRKGARRRA